MALFTNFQRSFLARNYSSRLFSTALKQVNEKLDQELEDIRTAGTWKAERVITSQQDVGISVHGSSGKILGSVENNWASKVPKFFGCS